MKIVRGLFVGLIVLILALGVIGWLLPSQVQVMRSIVINAPVSDVYAVIADFHQFNDWSPWRDLDPDASYRISGPNRDIGSRFEWFSDKPEVGSGSQTITALEPNSSIIMRLEFEGQKPAESFFRLSSVPEGTNVVWGFDTDLGANPYMHYFSLFMDRFLGPTYDDGLARLKRYIEQS